MTNPEKTWRKSSYTAPDNNCIEFAVRQTEIELRDSKDPGGGSFVVGPSAWTGFVAHSKSGGFRH
ncbi:DUF397 domain-containing protein [Lentzea sp. NPDC060358]|uniref:DUF397 domain-containing protein n=1 Tax=Lentzea sp. NPDC060358 TaxID=3347103 RepID=UPI0036585632